MARAGERENHQVILFDGVCNLCSASAYFIIVRDPREIFRFSPIKSRFSQDLLLQYGLGDIGDDSFVLVKKGQCYLRSDAALQISREMSGIWPLLYGLRFVPKSLRDFAYDLLARNRYRLFGQKEQCMVPTAKFLRRFIVDE